MKKVVSVIIGVFITVILLNMGVFAESMPIKKIMNNSIMNDSNTYVLLKNGCLLKTEDIYIAPNTKYEIIAENVIDSKYPAVLFNDGRLVNYFRSNNPKVVDTNVKQLYDENIYLKGKTLYENYPSYGKCYTYDNIMEILMYENSIIYALDDNNTLYACYEGKKIKIMDDIKKFSKKSKRIFSKNNEVVSFDLDKGNGTVQLNILTTQVSYENFCTGKETITNDNKLIEYGKTKATVFDEPNNVLDTVNGGAGDAYIDYLSLDNKMLQYRKYSSPKIIELFNGETFKDGSFYFAVGTNNNLYSLNLINKTKRLLDTDVDKILFYTYGNKAAIYQKMNGEIYYYNSDKNYQNEINCSKPFLYPLAQKQDKVIFNGKEIELEDNIQMRDGRSMYPFRAILESMGASVMWDSTNQKAIGTLNGNSVEFKIGTNEYIVNGEVRYMDTQSYVDDTTDKTYIPIRYVAEALGFRVDWKSGDTENRITINK